MPLNIDHTLPLHHPAVYVNLEHLSIGGTVNLNRRLWLFVQHANRSPMPIESLSTVCVRIPSI
jgi:hypothetical protein